MEISMNCSLIYIYRYRFKDLVLKRCFNFPLPKLAAEAEKNQSKAPPVTSSNHNLIAAEVLHEAESSIVKF